MVTYISRAAWVGAIAVSFCAVGAARGALMSNLGFEDLTGTDAAHFSSGQLIDGYMSAKTNPSSSAVVYVTPTPAPSWTADNTGSGTLNPTAAQMPSEAYEGKNVGYSTGSILGET